MSTNKIKIDHVTGGRNKDDLKNCYFEPSTDLPGAYNFYDKNGDELASDLFPGEPFEFVVDDLTWVLFDWTADSQRANGHWRNNGQAGPTLEQDGTFTAQAGGGADDETGEPDRILPVEQITIIDVRLEDGTKIDNALMGCFFAPQGPAGEYMFFESNGDEKRNTIKSGNYFEFRMGDDLWVLKAHFHAKEEKVDGHWHSFSPDDEEQGGTFTAQAGGGVPTAAYASA